MGVLAAEIHQVNHHHKEIMVAQPTGVLSVGLQAVAVMVLLVVLHLLEMVVVMVE
jgi:hypothetical protein